MAERDTPLTQQLCNGCLANVIAFGQVTGRHAGLVVSAELLNLTFTHPTAKATRCSGFRMLAAFGSGDLGRHKGC